MKSNSEWLDGSWDACAEWYILSKYVRTYLESSQSIISPFIKKVLPTKFSGYLRKSLKVFKGISLVLIKNTGVDIFNVCVFSCIIIKVTSLIIINIIPSLLSFKTKTIILSNFLIMAQKVEIALGLLFHLKIVLIRAIKH